MPKEWHTPPEVVTSQFRDSASASEVLERLSQERTNPRLDLIAIAAAWVRLAHLGWRSLKEVEKDPTLDELVDLTLRLLKRSLFEDLEPHARACANMYWASAKLKGQGVLKQHLTQLQESLNEAVVATSYYMSEQDVASVIWSSEQLNHPQDTLQTVMKSVTYRLVDMADRLRPQGASNILLAAAKLGERSPELLNQMPLMAEVLPDLIPGMDAQVVSNSVWAVAKLPREASRSLLPVIAQLSEQASKVRHGMNPQNIANLFYATALLRNEKRIVASLLKLVPILIDHLLNSEDLITDMKSQDLDNSLWSAQKLQSLVPETEELIPVLGGRIESVIPQMIDQEVSSTLLSIGQLPEHFEVLQKLVAPLARRMLSLLRGARLREVSNACWGLALCGHADASQTIQQTWLSTLSLISRYSINLMIISTSFNPIVRFLGNYIITVRFKTEPLPVPKTTNGRGP